MKITSNKKRFVFCALLLWLVSALLGAHSHLCLDGQEPPVSLHFSASLHQLDQHSNDQHLDVDIDIPQTLTAKLKSLDLPVLVLVVLLVIHLGSNERGASIYRIFHRHLSRKLRPPLRAPPVSI